jgi:hypothetical protein
MNKYIYILFSLFSWSLFGQIKIDSTHTKNLQELDLSQASGVALKKYKENLKKQRLNSFNKANITGVWYKPGKDSLLFEGEVSESFFNNEIKLQTPLAPENQKTIKDFINKAIRVQKDLHMAFSKEWFFTKNHCTQLQDDLWRFSMINKGVKQQYKVESNVNFWVKLDQKGLISNIKTTEKVNPKVTQELSFDFSENENKTLYKTLNANAYLDIDGLDKLKIKIEFSTN